MTNLGYHNQVIIVINYTDKNRKLEKCLQIFPVFPNLMLSETAQLHLYTV